MAAVDDGDPASGATEDQGGGEPGGAPTDHDDVVRRVLGHVVQAASRRPPRQRSLPELGIAGPMPLVDALPLAAALDQVGPRLRRIREQRGVTLTHLAATTGISKSTLSRLENGQRRPSLELLLPLAQAHRVPLDDLVGAPEVGDPRIRLKPRRLNGRTVVPLTSKAGAVQAWKIVIPASQSTPKPRVHDGYEWLYVLSGRMRLVLGEQDLVVEAGEVVEFETTLPHWFGSTGDGGAEVLSIFGRPGERMHVREAGT
jgi:transcriptional regulator with XRE-family HTH domain